MAGKPRASVAVGDRFGKLTVTADLGMRAASSRQVHFIQARCDCGSMVEIRMNSLISGLTKSCGGHSCRNHGLFEKHGMSGTPEYQAWAAMIQRCENPDNPGYPEYGGRGIKVYKPWHKFENFLADLGPKPEPKHLYSLGRFDNDGSYYPGNVGWQRAAEQTRNRRGNHWLEHDDERMVLTDWAKRLGMHEATLLNRLKKMSIKKALTMPRTEYARRLVRIEQFTDDQLLAELRRRGHDV
jgi:hypothetical protein